MPLVVVRVAGELEVDVNLVVEVEDDIPEVPTPMARLYFPYMALVQRQDKMLVWIMDFNQGLPTYMLILKSIQGNTSPSFWAALRQI